MDKLYINCHKIRNDKHITIVAGGGSIVTFICASCLYFYCETPNKVLNFLKAFFLHLSWNDKGKVEDVVVKTEPPAKIYDW